MSAKLIAHALLDIASTADLRLEVFSVGHRAHRVGTCEISFKDSCQYACCILGLRCSDQAVDRLPVILCPVEPLQDKSPFTSVNKNQEPCVCPGNIWLLCCNQ